MAPQTNIPPAANALGTIGTVFWCIQLIPQIWTNHRTRSTTGLPPLLPLLWALAACPLGTYSIIQAFNIPVQIQPQVFGSLSVVCWVQCLHFGSRWSLLRACLAGAALALALGGVELALVLTIRPIYNAGNETPVIVIGIVAAVVLAAGLLPPYYEIWKRGGRLIGFNMWFLFIDLLGAFFSALSLAVQNQFDVLGTVQYAVVGGLEVGIFALWFGDLWVHRRERRAAKEEGIRYADWVERRRLGDNAEEESVSREESVVEEGGGGKDTVCKAV